MSEPTPIKGRCGTCDWPTDSLPCPYCAAVAREARMTAAPTGPEPRTDAAVDMRVHREGEWWVIEVPGVGVTQARREEDIERMARDLVESLAGDGDGDQRTDAAVGR